MNLNSKKLTIPDLISVGVFTAIYFVLVTIATFSCALLPGVGNILLPAVAALISGSVYMLLAAKLQKFGGISIMGLVMGLFFFMSGHFVLSFAANIVCGVLADWVASRSQYRSKKVLLASYVIFSYGEERGYLFHIHYKTTDENNKEKVVVVPQTVVVKAGELTGPICQSVSFNWSI